MEKNRKRAGVFQLYIAMAIDAERAGQRRWTEKSLAAAADIPYTTYRRKMAGNATFDLDELARIAAALEIPVARIVREAEMRRDNDPDRIAREVIQADSSLSPADRRVEMQRLRPATASSDGRATFDSVESPERLAERRSGV